MEISEFTLRIIILLFPGVIATSIFNVYQNKTQNISQRDFVMMICISGVISYLPLLLIDKNLAIFRALLNADISIKLEEVFAASLIAIVVGVIMSVISNYALIYRLGNLLQISNKSGELSVWDEMFKDKGKCINKHIYIILPTEKLIYGGFVKSYSTSFMEKKELILQNVKIYKEDRETCIDSKPEVYFDLGSTDNFIIEFLDDGD